MAKKKSTARSRAPDTVIPANEPDKEESSHLWTQIPETLRDLIEAERARLMDAESVLHCAVIALDASDRHRAAEPYYQSVIGIARDLISKSINHLDLVMLEKALNAAAAVDAARIEDGSSVRAPQFGVREQVPIYLN